MKGIELDLFGDPAERSTAKVVECPACKTQFSIEHSSFNQSLSAIEQPYFHCSKCDYVFQHYRVDQATESQSAMSIVLNTPNHYSDKISAGPVQVDLQIDTDLSIEKNSPFQGGILDQHTNFASSHKESLSINSFKSFGALYALPLIAILFLAFFTLLSYQRPDLTHALARFSGKQFDALAPESVYLDQVSYNKMQLADGSTIDVISGEIVNDQDVAIKSLKLEAQLFNQAGELIQNGKIFSGLNLKPSELEGLTLDGLKSKLQSQGYEIVLRNRNRTPFQLPLLSKPQEAYYFTARIFSVKG